MREGILRDQHHSAARFIGEGAPITKTGVDEVMDRYSCLFYFIDTSCVPYTEVFDDEVDVYRFFSSHL